LALRVALTLAVARTDDSYSTLRQFRLFAQEYDDRRLALEIYALEQKSRRLWYDAPLSKTFVLGLLFQLFSDFGRSVWRPLGTLVALFVVSTSSLLALSNSVDCASTMRFKSSLLLSLNNTLPFLAWQKSSLLSAAESCLFSLGGGGLPYGLLSTIQMATSLTLLFLAGLAIRNTLKMQS
jgi:hypothetical protein